MDDLIESILDYVRSDYTDYAIMINGEWGSGKTYFWKHLNLWIETLENIWMHMVKQQFQNMQKQE